MTVSWLELEAGREGKARLRGGSRDLAHHAVHAPNQLLASETSGSEKPPRAARGGAVQGRGAALARGQQTPGRGVHLPQPSAPASFSPGMTARSRAARGDSAESPPPGRVAPSRERGFALRPRHVKNPNWN